MFSCTTDDQPTHVGCLCHQPGIQQLNRRISTDLSRRGLVAGAAAASLAVLGLPSTGKAQPAEPPRPVVLTNFRLFDGRSSALRQNLRLRVDGGRISGLAGGATGTPEGAQVIDCGGRVLMPGLIDAHWHTLFAGLSMQQLLAADVGFIHLAAAAEAERTLMRGFTTVRDLGGPVFAFKQAVDQGLVVGPRIYPSGGMITTSGGHGDLRALEEVPRQAGLAGPTERIGGNYLADSPEELRLRVREMLLQGASQIKLVGGGGVSSPRSPLDMSTFSVDELRVGIATAGDWNTYVTVHAYAPETIQRALTAGAQCIEHAHLMDEAMARMMADKGVWLSTQPFLSDADSLPLTGPSRVALVQVIAGTDNAYRLAIKHRVKVAWGSDMLFSPVMAARQNIMLTHLTRWYSNAQILTMATATNGELLALSGPRNPYPGKLGVIEDGAHADLLVVDGDPLTNIALLETPEKSLSLIMKGGKVFKNRLTPAA